MAVGELLCYALMRVASKDGVKIWQRSENRIKDHASTAELTDRTRYC